MTLAKDLFFTRIDTDHLALFGNQYVPNSTFPLYLVEFRDGRLGAQGYVQLQPSGQWYAWRNNGSFWVSFGKTRNEAGVATVDAPEDQFIPVQGRSFGPFAGA